MIHIYGKKEWLTIKPAALQFNLYFYNASHISRSC